jgi:hypothetical protein
VLVASAGGLSALSTVLQGHINKPVYDGVVSGEAVTLENALFPIVRGGTLQDGAGHAGFPTGNTNSVV